MGTIFENTKINLVKWFMAMCLISSNKKGVSSHQLSRDLNITQKTAWFILHKVHALFAQDDSVALEGEVSWMKCISAAWKPTSTSPRKPQILMGAPSRPRLPYSAWFPAGALPMPSWQKMSNRRHLSHTFSSSVRTMLTCSPMN